jgi:hypothetical protein
MDRYLILRAVHFAAMLIIELTFAGLFIAFIFTIPMVVSWLVVRPYGEDPQIDMMLCLLLLFILLKYPYDDIK